MTAMSQWIACEGQEVAVARSGKGYSIVVFPDCATADEIIRAIEAGRQPPRPTQLDLESLERAIVQTRPERPPLPQDEVPAVLTPRQREVMELVAEGRSNKEIARRLGLGPGTVKVHLAAAFRALGVNNRAAAVAAAMAQPPRA